MNLQVNSTSVMVELDGPLFPAVAMWYVDPVDGEVKVFQVLANQVNIIDELSTDIRIAVLKVVRKDVVRREIIIPDGKDLKVVRGHVIPRAYTQFKKGKPKRPEMTVEEILEMIGTYEAYQTLSVQDKGVSVAERYWQDQEGKRKVVLDMYIDAKFAKVMQILAPIYQKMKPRAEA